MNSAYVTDRKTRPISVPLSIIFTILTLGYMLPWMIAALRGKSNATAIGLLNLFVGWTVIGWIAALVMACTAHQITARPAQPYYPPQPPQPSA